MRGVPWPASGHHVSHRPHARPGPRAPTRRRSAWWTRWCFVRSGFLVSIASRFSPLAIPRIAIIDKDSVAPADFIEWRRDVRTLEHLSAAEWWDANLSGIEEPRTSRGIQVTARIFRGLRRRHRARPNVRASEEESGCAPTRHSCAMRSGAVDSRPTNDRRPNRPLDGEPYEVIGIAPPGFSIPLGDRNVGAAGVRLQQTAARAAPRRTVYVVGRIKDESRSRCRPCRSEGSSRDSSAKLSRHEHRRPSP